MFRARTEADENAASIKRVPRQYITKERREDWIRRARNGEDIHAYSSARGANWNVWINGGRVWLNDPEGDGAA